jgi:hypothetical protein
VRLYDGHICDLRMLRVLRLGQESRYGSQHIARRNSKWRAEHLLLLHVVRIRRLLLPGLARSKSRLLWMQRHSKLLVIHKLRMMLMLLLMLKRMLLMQKWMLLLMLMMLMLLLMLMMLKRMLMQMLMLLCMQCRWEVLLMLRAKVLLRVHRLHERMVPPRTKPLHFARMQRVSRHSTSSATDRCLNTTTMQLACGGRLLPLRGLLFL